MGHLCYWGIFSLLSEPGGQGTYQPDRKDIGQACRSKIPFLELHCQQARVAYMTWIEPKVRARLRKEGDEA